MSPISDDRLGGDNLRDSLRVPLGTDGGDLRDGSTEAQPYDAVDWEKARVENESWLRAVCYKILKDRNAVEDVMQNVWLDVFRGGVSLRDPSKVKPWLRSVVVNKSNEYIRKLVRDRNTKQLYDEQFAEDMRSTVTAVQSQLHRARLRLREEIQRLYGRENV